MLVWLLFSVCFVCFFMWLYGFVVIFFSFNEKKNFKCDAARVSQKYSTLNY